MNTYLRQDHMTCVLPARGGPSFAITALEDLLKEWRFLEAHPDVEGEVEDDRRVMWTTDNVEIAEKYGFEAWPPSDC